MKKLFFLISALALLTTQFGLVALAQNRVDHILNPNAASAAAGTATASSDELNPDENGRRGGGRVGAALTTGGTTSTSALINHGGSVMKTPRIYLIWYGNWNQSNGSDTPAGKQIILDWANSIGGSPHFAINATYPPTASISGSVLYGGQTTDSGTSTRLSDTAIKAIVSNSISSGRLPNDSTGVYFVVTSSNVTASSGFCTQYCGWHTHATLSGTDIKYSFVGNANRCLTSCAAQSSNSPNGNPGIDGAISVMTHELEEATTDPDLNAWYDSSGAENGDKCAWTFGHSQYLAANGSYANVHLGARDFLIQRNLLYSAGSWFCMMNSTQN